jgi:hypothetical protein
VHIHFKVRLFNGNVATYTFTSQFFFNDAVSDAVYLTAPYNRRGSRDTRNSSDAIYNGASLDNVVKSSSGAYLLPEVDKTSTEASVRLHVVLKR